MSGKDEGEESGKDEGEKMITDEKPTLSPVSITSRGFSGTPKFSDFVRSSPTGKSSDTKNSSDDPKGEGKGTKPSGTNQRGIIDDYVFDNHPSDHEIDTSAIDEELDSPDGLVERITGKISSVKQEIKEFAHEVKEFIDRSINR